LWLLQFLPPQQFRESPWVWITKDWTRIFAMKRGMLLLFLALSAFAQTGKQSKPLTNADVVEMWRVGVPESTIILAIKKTPV
jgi:hypothetical protein